MPSPDPNVKFPIPNYRRLAFLKNIVEHPQIEIGDYTYYDDETNATKFLEHNVKYLFEFTGDKLIIGKFCTLAAGVTFLMNGGNHLLEATSTYSFAIFGGE